MDELLERLYEQAEPDKTPLHVSLKKRPEDRPHFLSLIWLAPPSIAKKLATDAGSWVQDWDLDTRHVQTSHLHLTIATFGQVGQGFNATDLRSADPTTKLRQTLKHTEPFRVQLTVANIGRSGVNLEAVPVRGNSDPFNRLRTSLEAVPDLRLQPLDQLSISLVRYLNVRKTDIWRGQLQRLLALPVDGYHTSAEVNELTLASLDKVAEYFEIVDQFKLQIRA
jgi:2'-5' RNA ligase